jgi:hypothetical protein
MSKKALDALSPDKRSELIGLARYLGIQIPENEIMDRFCEASGLYHLWPPPPEIPKGWIIGFDVLKRWRRKPDPGEDALGTWIYLRIGGRPLPNRFLFSWEKNTPDDMECRFSRQIEAEEKAREQNRQEPRNPWLFKPQLWWFKLEDVEFCEKANSLIRDRMDRKHLSPFWLTLAEVQTRWNKDRQALQGFVTERIIDGNGLQAYYYRKPHHSLRHSELATAAREIMSSGISLVDKTRIDEKPSSFLDTCLFRLEDVQDFEDRHRDKMPLYWKQDRQRCRDLAWQWLWENPELTRPKTIARLKETTWGRGHTDKILIAYLDGVPLEKGKPGRPKGSTNRQKKTKKTLKKNSF